MFSGTFFCVVSLAFPPSPLLSLAFSCLPLPDLIYHIGTCLKSGRASRSLLRQVFFRVLLNKENSLLSAQQRGEQDVVIRGYVETLAEIILEAC